MAQTKELVAKIIFAIAAAISVAAVVVICVFIFGNGIPAIAEIGFFDFLFGTTWRPSNDAKKPGRQNRPGHELFIYTYGLIIFSWS